MKDYFNLRKSKWLLLMLLAMIVGGVNSAWADELTVNDGTNTNQYIPVFGNYVDTQNTISEFIIPADRLEDLTGGTISGMTFYLSSPQSGAWGSAVFEVYMKEVTATSYESTSANTEGTNTVVYSGSLDGSQSTMAVSFYNNYVYGGGNLLVGFKVTTTGTYKGTYFYGESQAYGSNNAFHYATSSQSGRDSFLPKVTFTYTAGVGVLKKPSSVTAGNVTMNSATISWTAGGSETSWEVSYSTSADEPAADGSYTTVNTNSYELTGLTSGTTYYVYVRAVDGDNKSKWSNVCSFTPGMLTINNTSTTTNSYVPIYGYDMDSYKVKSQFVLPASSLTSLSETQITKVVFYGTDSRNALGNNTFNVYMAEVADATISSLVDWTTLETVYSGSLSLSDGKMTITLPDGFDYSGGNLLIGFLQTAGTSWTNLTWTGVSATDASLSGSSSASQRNFLPQISFYYTAQTTTVKKPKNLAASDVATTTATLGWTDGEEGLTAWQIAYSTNADFVPDTEGTKVDVDANPYTLTELTAATTYYAYIRAKKGDDYSAWSNKVEFTTLSAVPVMVLSTTSINFGIVSDAEAQAQTFTVTNEGGAAMNAFSVKPAGEGFSVSDTEGNELPQTIAPGESVTVKVKMNVVGSHSDELVITAGGEVAEQRVAVTGYLLDNTKIAETFASAASVSRWTVASGWTFNATTGAYAGTSSRTMTTPKLTVAAGDALTLNVKLGWSGGSLTVEGLDADGNTVYNAVTYNSTNGGLNTSSYTLLTISDIPTTVTKIKLTGYYAYINVFNGFSYVNDPVLGLFSNEACTSAQTSPATKNFGFANEAQSQLYYIKNTGNGQIDLTIEQADGFTASVDDAALAEGEKATLTVTMTATEGLHDGTITVTAKNHDNDAVLGTFVVNANGGITGSKNNVVLTAFPAGWQNNNWAINNGAARIWSSTPSDLITTSLKVTEGEKLLVEAYKYYSTDDSQLSYSYSTNNGTTWSDAVSLTDQLTTSYKIIAISGIPAGNVLMKFTGTYAYIRQIYGFEAVAEPIMTFTAADYSFGMISSATTTDSYTITNDGTATLENLSVTCDNANFEIAVADNATEIAAGGTATFTVTLKTTALGVQSGTVTVSGDDVTSKTFNVSGYVADDTKIFETFASLPDRWTNSGWSFNASGANATSSSSKLETPKIKIAEGEKLAISAKQQYSGSYYVTINGSADNGATWTAYTKTLGSDVLNNTDYTVVELSDIPTTVNKLQLVGYYVYVNGLNGFTYDDNDPQFAMYSDVECTSKIAATSATNAWGFVTENKTTTYYIKNDGTGTMTLAATDAPAGFTATLGATSLGAGESTSLVIAMANNAETNEGYHAGDVVLTAKDNADNTLGTFTVTSSGVVVGSKTDVNFATLTAFPAGWEATNWTVTANTKATVGYTSGTLTTGTYTVADGESLVIEGKGNSNWGTPSLTYQYSTDGGTTWTAGASTLTFTYSATTYAIQTISDIPAGDVVIKFTGSYVDIQRIYGYTAVAKANIALDKADDYDFGMQTADAEYVITVTNNGTAAMTGLTATLATGADYSVEVSKTDLAVNETATVTVTQKFDAAKGLASLADVLTISADDIAGKTINLSGKTRDASKWYVDFAEGSIPSSFVETGSWSASSYYAATTSSTESSLITQPITLAAGEKIQFEAKNPYSGSLKVRYSVNGGISWSNYVDYSSKLNSSSFTLMNLDLENAETVTAVIEFCGRYYVQLDNIYGGTLNSTSPMIKITKSGNAVESGVTEEFGSIKTEATTTYTISNAGNGTLTITSPVTVTGEATATVSETSLTKGQSATLTITMPVAAPYEYKEGAVTVKTSLGDFVINYNATILNPNALDEQFASGKPAGWYFGSMWSISSNQAVNDDASITDLITEQLHVTGTTDALTFQAKNYSSRTAATWSVAYSTDRVNWTDVDVTGYTLSYSNWTTVTVDGLNEGDYYLRIKANRLIVDNFLGWEKKNNTHDLYVTESTFPATTAKGNDATISVTVTSLIAAEAGVYAKLFINEAEEAGQTSATQDISLNGIKTFSFTYTIPENKTAQVKVYYSDGTEAFATAKNDMKVSYELDETVNPGTIAEGTFNVTLKRQFAEGWNTVCLPFAINDIEGVFGEGAKAYAFVNYDNGVIGFQKTNEIAAATPYVLYVPSAITEDMLFSNATISSTTSGNVEQNGAIFRGTYAPVAAGEWTKNADSDVIYGVTGQGKIAKAGANASIDGFRAYFDLPANASPSRLSFIDEDGSTTIINGIVMDKTTDENVYNLNGQRVETLKKGNLYIINGKKVIRK